MEIGARLTLVDFFMNNSNQALVCMYIVFLLDLCFSVRCSSFDLQLFESIPFIGRNCDF